RLDLDRRDPDPADFQHVVRAAAVPEVAILVLVVLVARLDPRAEERLFGLLVLVPVVRHRGVALDTEVADLALRHGAPLVVHDGELVARHGKPRGAGARRARTVRDEAVAALRRAEPVDARDAQALAPALVNP